MSNTVWGTLAILALVGPIGCSDPTGPMTLRFFGSSSVEVTRDGVVSGTTTYMLVSLDDGGTTTIEYVEGIFGFASQGLGVTQDVLILRDGCCDGFTYRFERAS